MNDADMRQILRVAAKQSTPVESVLILLATQILDELKAIRQATEQANEPGPDDEPSPFQSLSG